MEMFDHIGLAPRIDELRERCPGNRFHFRELTLDEQRTPTLDFGRLPGTQYNYYGKVNQNDLDRALRASLAANHALYPEYGVEYLDSVQDGDAVRVRLRHGGEEGTVEEVTVPWLVGTDGSRSSVRAGLGLAFEQREGASMSMSMVDARLEGFRGDRNWVNYYVSEKGFMLVTGLPGGKFRLYLAGELEKLLQDAPPQKAFQQGLDFFDTGARIAEMDWSSTWEIRKIVGETYSKGRVILCGDATHVHSPAGGQGMNACMQDAFNLGWKLALLIQRRAQPGVLESYGAERRPIAQQVTAGADRMHQILFNASIPVAERFKLTQDPAWHDEAILRISALSHNYRGVDGTLGSVELPASAPLPGDRAPDCVLSEQPPRMRLYDALRHPGFTLLVVPESSEQVYAAYAECASQLRRAFGHLVRTLLVTPVRVPGIDPDELLLDPLQQVQATYGGAANQLILVRPDLYIGFRGTLGETLGLQAYVGKWVPAARLGP
ncbi:FAD-dependent monooxygenase [Variovorax defluvii]|uniref:FAD-dependent monooxygenase n=2 Tax=Variovorax defluvii TaxID=913761 RepID=A0ABP8IDJ9_9BURK